MKLVLKTFFLFLIHAAFMFPAIAYANEKLAYLEFTGKYWQVFLLGAENKTNKQISNTEYDVSAISWLSDGGKLFINGIQGEAEILDLATGHTEIISLPFDTINDAVISPEGKQIVFSAIAENSPNNKLWLYDIKKKILIPLFKDKPGRQYDPKWGKDNNTVYFISGIANQFYGIEKGDIKTNQSMPVVKNSYYNLDVDVSRNGNITYSSNVSGDYNIWVMQGRSKKRVTSKKGTESRPSWSSNQTRLYFEAIRKGITNIWSIDMNAREQERVQVTFSERGARYPLAFKGGE